MSLKNRLRRLPRLVERIADVASGRFIVGGAILTPREAHRFLHYLRGRAERLVENWRKKGK